MEPQLGQSTLEGRANPARDLDGRATTVLVLGIVGLAVFQLLAPVAWYLGNGVKRDAATAGLPEPGTSKAGRICGIVGTVALLVGAVFVLLALQALSRPWG
jgi:hypothetical protein